MANKYARTMPCRIHPNCEVAIRSRKPKSGEVEAVENDENVQTVRKGKIVLCVFHLPIE